MRLALFLCLVALSPPAAAEGWVFESAQTLPSSDTGWDYMTFDAAANRLFIARRGDGLLVWDVNTREARTVEDSKGANGVVLVPDARRAYVAMTDGSLLTLDLVTLKPLARVDLGEGDLNMGMYEPTQKRVHMVTGARPEKTVWITLDAMTGAVLGRTEFNSKKMDTPATDGQGAIFAPMRDRNLLQQLDAKDLSLQKTWRLGECMQPTVVEWDAGLQRVLVACRGEKPVFVALNPAAGVVATLPIGRGVDGLAVDDARHLVVTANGIDATLSMLRNDGADGWSGVETVSTRPMARVLARDPATNRLFSVSASYTTSPPEKEGAPPKVTYHADSFTILTWRPN